MFVDWVMRGIETVRYVKIWDKAPKERKWKIDYLKKTFKADNVQLVRDLNLAIAGTDEKAKAKAKTTYQVKLDSHRKRHYRTIENRRPLALLYDHVRHAFCSLHGKADVCSLEPRFFLNRHGT